MVLCPFIEEENDHNTFIKNFAVLRNTGIFNTFIKGFNPILKTFNSKNNVEQNFRKTLESLGPVFIKLGQLLSTRTDIISKELQQN